MAKTILRDIINGISGGAAILGYATNKDIAKYETRAEKVVMATCIGVISVIGAALIGEYACNRIYTFEEDTYDRRDALDIKLQKKSIYNHKMFMEFCDSFREVSCPKKNHAYVADLPNAIINHTILTQDPKELVQNKRMVKAYDMMRKVMENLVRHPLAGPAVHRWLRTKDADRITPLELVSILSVAYDTAFSQIGFHTMSPEEWNEFSPAGIGYKNGPLLNDDEYDAYLEHVGDGVLESIPQFAALDINAHISAAVPQMIDEFVNIGKRHKKIKEAITTSDGTISNHPIDAATQEEITAVKHDAKDLMRRYNELKDLSKTTPLTMETEIDLLNLDRFAHKLQEKQPKPEKEVLP